MQARLLGALATTATHVGGTGYRREINDDIQTRASSPQRLARFTEAKPTIMIVEVGINDPWPGTGPTTLESMKTLLQGARAANPDSILVAVGPWEPNESDARQPDGQDIAVMNAISATWNGVNRSRISRGSRNHSSVMMPGSTTDHAAAISTAITG